MKTKLTMAVTVMALLWATGCREKEKSEEIRPKLNIEYPSQNLSMDTSRIRFNQMKKKDEKTLAMERMSGQWNRNLYLMGGNPSLEECSGDYGQNP
jgi:hypothetical protein